MPIQMTTKMYSKNNSVLKNNGVKIQNVLKVIALKKLVPNNTQVIFYII